MKYCIMKKYLLYAFGTVALLSGCSQDQFIDLETNSRTVTASSSNNKLSDQGIPGIAHIKVQDALRDEIQKISPNGISLNSAPSPMAATLKSIKANHIERLFTPDPRFEKRMHREGLDRWYIVSFDEKQDLKQTLTTLASNPQFEIVEEVYVQTIPTTKATFSVFSPTVTRGNDDMPFNDPKLKMQWHYKNFGITPRSVEGADINLFEAWKQTTGSPNVIVSIVDGGIDGSHEDLKDNLWINEGEIPGNGIDDDGNGFIDDVYGYNFVSDKGEITLDEAGHGTHVAGTVAARNNNGIGVSGVAGGDGTPNSGARLMSCQIFEGANGSGQGARATVYGANNGAVISQNSWGYDYPGPGNIPASIREAIDYFIKYAGCDNDGKQLPNSPMKGGVVIYAAGNDDKDYLSYPSAYPPVISVAAMAPNWEKAWYTNRGDWVDIMAPGGDEYFTNGMVYSTVPGSLYDGEMYGYMQGTSMACPHVSGIAALIVSKLGGPGFTNEELKNRLLGSLRPENIDVHNPNYAGRLGIGYIDAARTLAENKNQKPENISDLKADPEYTGMILHWTAVKDEDDGTAIKYLLYFSDKQLTASNYKSITPYTINAQGYKPGEKVTYKISNLKENVTYYAAVIAADRWGLESDFAASEFKTLKNDPPVIEDVPQNVIRVSGAEVQSFTVKISDPNGHKISYALKGESRGVSAIRTDDNLKFTLRAVAPVGKYDIELVVIDELGASTSVKIPFEVYVYESPFLSNSIQNMLIGKDEAARAIDLTQHFTYQSGSKVTINASSSDNSVVTATVNASTLSVKGNKPGQAFVSVSVSDGNETAQTKFQVSVVANTGDIVYQIYPMPATTMLNVLVNPEIKKAEFTIRSIFGEKVFSKSYTINGMDPVKLNIQKLSAGTYTLVMESNKGTYKKTFVKQ